MKFIARVEYPVLWHEGMLLTPQHFQQHDQHWFQLLRHQMEQLQPNYWGLIEFSLNEARLAEGICQVERLRAVLPDGLVVEHGVGEMQDAAAESLTADLQTAMSLSGKTLVRVYLSVPNYVAGAASDRANVRRYDSFVGPVAVDDNTGEDPYSVIRLKPRLSLSAGVAPPKGTIPLTLLEVKRDPSGAFIVTNYHAPLLELGASEYLGKRSIQNRLSELLRTLRNKVQRMSAMKSNRAQNLFALSAVLPQLEVLVNSRRAHPASVYSSLALLVGHASALDPNGVPPFMAPYNHDDAEPQFTIALDYVRRLVDSLELEYELVEFEQREPGVFSIYLDADADLSEVVIELMPSAGQTLAMLEAWLRTARIGAEKVQETLQQQRSPGVWWEPMDGSVVNRFTQRANVALFLLRNRDVQTSAGMSATIVPGESFVIRGHGRTTPPRSVVWFRHAKAERGHGDAR